MVGLKVTYGSVWTTVVYINGVSSLYSVTMGHLGCIGAFCNPWPYGGLGKSRVEGEGRGETCRSA